MRTQWASSSLFEIRSLAVFCFSAADVMIAGPGASRDSPTSALMFPLMC